MGSARVVAILQLGLMLVLWVLRLVLVDPRALYLWQAAQTWSHHDGLGGDLLGSPHVRVSVQALPAPSGGPGGGGGDRGVLGGHRPAVHPVGLPGGLPSEEALHEVAVARPLGLLRCSRDAL